MEYGKMLKRILFAAAPLMLIAGSVVADDDLLSKVASMDLDDVKADVAEVEDMDELGLADVEALLDEDKEASDEDAVAACFRRVGYSYGGSSYGYRSYNYSYHTPVYRSYYTPTYHYTPTYYTPVTYHSYTPVYNSYWGCW